MNDGFCYFTIHDPTIHDSCTNYPKSLNYAGENTQLENERLNCCSVRTSFYPLHHIEFNSVKLIDIYNATKLMIFIVLDSSHTSQKKSNLKKKKKPATGTAFRRCSAK